MDRRAFLKLLGTERTQERIAYTVHEAARMLGAAERSGCIHMIDHELRFNPNRRRVKELLDSGRYRSTTCVSMSPSRRRNSARPCE